MNAPKKPCKSAPARDPSSGQFEVASPFSDPDLAHMAVRTVRAISDLQPILAELARGDDERAKLTAVAGLVLSLLKDSVLQELAVDPQSLKDAKKKRLEAVALGNMPLAEQNRIMGMAQAWLALPDAPALTMKGGDPTLPN